MNVKLLAGAALICALTGYLGYLGAAASWRYYVLVDECVADADQLTGHRLRVSGTIAPGSLVVDADQAKANFLLVGEANQLQVTCAGPFPDNLAERVDVVVEGTLTQQDLLTGERVLTRCASKYESASSPKSLEARQPNTRKRT